MDRPAAAQTKLVICVWHTFTLWRPPPEMAAQVRARWPEMRVVHVPQYDGLDKELGDTDIFVGYSLRPAQFMAAKKLKWIHATAAGVTQLMYPELRGSNVVVTNVRGIHSVTMAEHTLGMLIAMARHFPASVRHQSARHWGQQEIWDMPVRPREMRGQLLVIVGLGAVGMDLARLARGLGMRIWAVTRTGRGDTSLTERILPVAQLEEALAQADFVVLAAPETPETQRMIGARELAAMKPAAYLVNVARGSLVDESALVETLAQRRIAGAALDVTNEEPLPASSPLWGLDNVFITPHLSGATEHLWERQTQVLLENLEHWFRGDELINRVDLARGY